MYRWITFRAWVFSARFAAVFASIFLFAIRRKAVLFDVLAVAVTAPDELGDHSLT